MAPSKRIKAKRSTTSAGAAEYRFRIDAFTPETMPMARLAEYMSQLAQLLGEPTYVARELAARLVLSDVITVNKASANRWRPHAPICVRCGTVGDIPQERIVAAASRKDRQCVHA
jgi:hypothetical protein